MNYMRDYISNYILVQKKYNKQTLPVLKPYWGGGVPSPGDVYDVLSMKVELTMKNLVSLDSAAGSMTAAVFLDLYWKDNLLNWDPQWTDGYEFFDIDYTLLWTPDILLYNSIGKFSDQMGTPALFLSSDGSAWWDSSGLLTFSCEFDTTNFPFDTQTCHAIFGSWTYASYELNITEAVVVVDSAFSNIAWNVRSVSGMVTEGLLWEEYPYNFAVYDFSMKRYYNHYVSNAIIPSLLVTFLSLISLWIDDVGVRLSIGITSLLALIAVQVTTFDLILVLHPVRTLLQALSLELFTQWTVSSEIPVSNNEPWLSKLSNVCIVYTTVVCMEGYLIGYMRRRHERRTAHGGDSNIPYAVEKMIDVSRWLDAATVAVWQRVVLLVLFLCGAVTASRPGSNAHVERSTVMNQTYGIDRESNMGTAVELTSNPISAKKLDADTELQSEDPGQASCMGHGVSVEQVLGSERLSSSVPEPIYTWGKATAALDHLCRFALPTSYCIILLVFFAEISS
jgi:hypothetical protein